MSLIARRCLNRSRLVEELLETWQIEHEAAMLVQDLEQLVQECLELAELLERAWQRIKAEAYRSGPVDEASGLTAKMAVCKSLAVIKKVREVASFAHQRAEPSVNGVAELDEAVVQIQIIKDDIDSIWPKLDYAMIENSLASYKKGDFKTIEDLFDVAHRTL